MWIIGAILIGFVVGLLARFLMPGRDKHGFFVTSLIGIVGSIVASYLGVALGWYYEGEPAGFLASIVGAMIVLGIFRMLKRD